MVFSQILVAFDGSEDSVLALQKAKELAFECKSNLTIAYVHDENYAAPLASEQTVIPAHSHGFVGTAPSPNRMERAASKQMDHTPEKVLEKARNLLESIQYNADYETLYGNPAKEICDFANNMKVDLIVIGSRGLGKIKKMMMGSVSNKVTNNAHCPVLVVK
ncbi:universal stress protein [Gracilibacillus dipsosauri]|uniref:UspA domain-containing protein n=1 Tax=Gracilibacillus dipsosauri TaxID=178340 RepID=A0A317KVR3_9BACI|nr:universal stress protein [Gracilibacillus dipsosauri]PWU67592.1 hypothetical protein DLJ74_14105 [Gracilibacillus dipsosauri]